LEGDTGDDALSGNVGADVYSFALGDGKDVIEESALYAQNFGDDGSTDVVRFGDGITREDLVLARRANGDLVIGYRSGDQVTVKGQYFGRAEGIERIELAGGETIERAELDAIEVTPIVGT